MSATSRVREERNSIMTDFGTPPPIAREHCRHYNYERGLEGGPRCAVGIDLSVPGASFVCMPGKEGTRLPCPKRENWTAEEKAAWEVWQAERTKRMIAAIAALPALDGRAHEKIDCPSCDGQITYVRIPTRAYVECSTPHCTSFEANVRGHWPATDDNNG